MIYNRGGRNDVEHERYGAQHFLLKDLTAAVSAKLHLTMSTPSTETFYLPETMTDWPFLRTLSPHYPEVAIESVDWILGVRPIDERLKVILNKAQVGENISRLESEATSSVPVVSGLYACLVYHNLSRGAQSCYLA